MNRRADPPADPSADHQPDHQPDPCSDLECLRCTLEARYQALEENALSGIITIDERGTIETFNPAAERIFQWQANEVIGKNVSMLMPAPHRENHDDYLRAYLTTGEARIVGIGREVEGLRKDGTHFEMDLAVNEITQGGHSHFTGVVHDISERKGWTRILEARARRQAAIAEFGQRALTGLPVAILMDEAAELAATMLDVPFSMVLEHGPESPGLTLAAGRGWSESRVGSHRIARDPDSLAGFTLRSPEPVVIRDLSTDVRFQEEDLLHEHGVVSGVSVTIATNRTLGMLAAYTREEREFSGDEVNFLKSLANVLAHAIEQREISGELLAAREKLEQRVAQRTTELMASNTRLRREVVKRARIEKRQERLLADLEKANAELKDFAYIISHDLKAPLRAINTLAQWITKDHGDALNAEGREYLELLSGRVVRLNNLIDGILRYSRAGRVSPTPAKIDTVATVRDVIRALHPPDHLAFDVDDDLPTVAYDRTLLEQVLQNLIGNAITHHGKPTGRIRISGETSDDAWTLTVADDGVGIEERYFERIFKIFQSLRARDETESTGIGLTIVKKIVERFGGRVEVSSEVGEGSAFTFTIPRTENAYPPGTSKSSS